MSRIIAQNALRPISVRLMCSSAQSTEVTAAKKNTVTLLGKDNPDSVFYIGPERDLVNYPRRQRPIEAPAVRLGFIPEEWFQQFHAKTGVTGPYMFIASVSTFLISKEIYVLEHEFYTGIGLFIVCAGAIKLVGPSMRQWMDTEMGKEEAALKAIRQDEIDSCKAAIKEEEKAQWMATSWETLIQAKKENVALQLEAAYRQRLQEAFSQVKRRLDYQMETTNVLRRTEQKHMVDWIIANVRKSISPKLEDEALKKCVSDLKGLAATANH
jgi:F-type H+-transporting ATPase subunit b